MFAFYVGWLEFNIRCQHQYGYIRDDCFSCVRFSFFSTSREIGWELSVSEMTYVVSTVDCRVGRETLAQRVKNIKSKGRWWHGVSVLCRCWEGDEWRRVVGAGVAAVEVRSSGERAGRRTAGVHACAPRGRHSRRVTAADEDRPWRSHHPPPPPAPSPADRRQSTCHAEHWPHRVSMEYLPFTGLVRFSGCIAAAQDPRQRRLGVWNKLPLDSWP